MLMKLVAKFAASLAVLGLSFNVLAAELNVYASMPEKYASQVLDSSPGKRVSKSTSLDFLPAKFSPASRQRKVIPKSMFFWEVRQIILKLLRTKG